MSFARSRSKYRVHIGNKQGVLFEFNCNWLLNITTYISTIQINWRKKKYINNNSNKTNSKDVRSIKRAICDDIWIGLNWVNPKRTRKANIIHESDVVSNSSIFSWIISPVTGMDVLVYQRNTLFLDVFHTFKYDVQMKMLAATYIQRVCMCYI